MPGVLWMIRLLRVVLGVYSIGAGLGVVSEHPCRGCSVIRWQISGLIGISSGASMAAVVMIIIQNALPVFHQVPALNFYALA